MSLYLGAGWSPPPQEKACYSEAHIEIRQEVEGTLEEGFPLEGEGLSEGNKSKIACMCDLSQNFLKPTNHIKYFKEGSFLLYAVMFKIIYLEWLTF